MSSSSWILYGGVQGVVSEVAPEGERASAA